MNLRSIVLSLVMLASLAATSTVVKKAPLTTIPQGVRVNGIDVGGMTFAQVESVLASRMKKQGQEVITVTLGEKKFPVKPSQIGLKIDIASVIEELKSHFGGTYSLWRRGVLKKWAKRGYYVLHTPVIYNRSEIHRIFSEMQKGVESPPKNARLDLINRKVLPSENGQSMDLAGSIARFE
ncbi:hypothetical protein KJ865_16355, partial [Myxococcota bacterium]|nr:hypothetical protein [Myxococcota bacterium]